MDPAHHVPREQLFPLMHALRRAPPPAEGEGADPELAGVLAALPEPFHGSLPADQRLGEETVARLLAHARGCPACRCLLLEDGPASRPPKTAADLVGEASQAEELRKKKVIKFWTSACLGLGGFVGSQISIYEYRVLKAKERGEEQGPRLQTDPTQKGLQIHPLLLLAMALVLVAAWFLAEAYVLARELWIDWTRLKAAVPVVGKRWAAKGKEKGP
jgi:hypothetical protein